MLPNAIIISCTLACLAGGTADADSFQVSSWFLETAIINLPDIVGDVSEVVQNPFTVEHQVILGDTSRAASYFSFSWSPDTASFLVAGSHIAFDGNGGTRSLSAGNVHITPSVDLLLTATGRYDYDMPGPAMQIAYGLGVFGEDFSEFRFGHSHLRDTWLEGPPSGQIFVSEQGILPAGETSIITYGFILDAMDSSGLLASGEGFIEWTLTPVPEPATISMVVFGAMILSRRHAR